MRSNYVLVNYEIFDGADWYEDNIIVKFKKPISTPGRYKAFLDKAEAMIGMYGMPDVDIDDIKIKGFQRLEAAE